jgi:hypothetical protein
MRVLATSAVLNPVHDVEAWRELEGQLVAVEEINDEGGVALSSVVVRQQLAVLPDAIYICDIEDAATFLGHIRCWRGQVGVGLAVGGLDELAFGLSPTLLRVSSQVLTLFYLHPSAGRGRSPEDDNARGEKNVLMEGGHSAASAGRIGSHYTSALVLIRATEAFCRIS